MTPKRHAKLARDLIAACGGLDEAAAACRVGASRLSDYQLPQLASTMPADVMADLEAYCGEPIYSRELAAMRPWEPTTGGVLQETHEAMIAGAALLPLAAAVERGEPGAQERYEDALALFIKEVRDVKHVSRAANVSELRRA